ncbi:type-F conjugative transfer system pilin assembly protein TraF [Serratia sp. S1B]|nr:type-F conjugative transfer system pilin assembly protein TraF [Serratia sp. S1B]
MKIKITLMTIAWLAVASVYAGPSPGWQWYNEPPKSQEEDEEPKVAKKMSAMEKMKKLQRMTEEAKAEAILYPTVENFVRFFKIQNYWTQQAGLFSQIQKKSMLEHPELDYNLKYSHYNGTVKNQLAADYAAQRDAIKQIAQKFGVIFFYRGKDPIDGQLVGVIKNFRDTYGLTVISVSIDGVINPQLPESRYDSGQAEKIGVRYFPALMLVDPKSEEVKPLAYGFISQDDLAKQFLNVFTDFKPNF